MTRIKLSQSATSLRYLLALSVSWIALSGSHAFAQAEESPSVSGSGRIEEIVVLAQHRKQNIQLVPIAVSAFTATQAKKEGVTDAQSLASMVPGLQFNRQVSNSTPFLRGVGSTVGQAGDEPSVAYYVDDVYIPSGAGSFANFNSVDRLEVEKGPQGTLFGRNATGGVIQVFTKDPTAAPTADVSLGYANYDTKSGSIYASSALTSKLAANIAVYGSKQDDGWGRNVTLNQPSYSDQWDFGGRIKFLWTPSDDTNLLLTVDRDTTRTSEGTDVRIFPGTLDGYGGIPGFTAAAPPGFYDSAMDKPVYSITRQSGVSLKATHDFDWAQFVSITAYRMTNAYYSATESDSALPLVNYTNTAPDRTETQEFRLLSPKGSTLTWIAGLYYFNDISGYDPLQFSDSLLLPSMSQSSLQYSDSYSGFGQATATILPATHLTVGLRYTMDERTIYAYDVAPFGPGGTYVSQNEPNSPQSKKWDKVTYRFALDHQFTPDAMGYIAYNRGFKSGTFNTVIIAGSDIGQAVAPEVLDSYTIGAKTEWFDHRLRLNTEAFWYQYKNIQVEAIVAGETFLQNAAAATIKGIDLDMQATPIDHLTLTAGAEVMDGHYDSFPGGILYTYDPVTGGNTQSTLNEAGKHSVETPPFSLSASVNYMIPLQKLGTLALNVAWSHTGNYYNNPDNGIGQLTTNDDRQPIINLVNASANWTSENGIWGVQLWGKNITGEKYYSDILETSFSTDYSPAPPATFGVTVSYHFGA